MADTTVNNSIQTVSIVPYEQRRGLTICVISRGSVPSQWMAHLLEKVTKRVPSGVYWNFCMGIDKLGGSGDYASLRNYCVSESLRRGSKYIMFIDDDVYVPEDAIGKFLGYMQKGMKVVSGLYYKKSPEVEPVIFKELGSGPYYTFPINEVFEIEGSGAGCVMIDSEVFDKMRENGLPYFKQDWLMDVKDADGNNGKIQVEIGEDHWLYYQAKKLGYKIYCDSSLCCDHQDVKTGKMYPVSEEVYRIRGKDLSGKNLDIASELKRFDNNKKKNILFLNTSAFEFNGNTIKEKPIGGSETAIIHTARLLTDNYNVIVATRCDKEGVYDGALYIDNSKIDILQSINIDLCAVVRGHELMLDPELKKRIKAKKYWLWMQDYPMYPGYERFLQSESHFEKLICVSNDHKLALMNRFPCQIDENKILVFENGVDPTLYLEREVVKKKKNQFYYSSTPYRGLEQLLEIFPKIKEKVPDATLKVCSSLKVYGDQSGDLQYENLYKKCKDTPGVEYVGSLKQLDLAKVAMESYLMLYPSVFAETACISVMEAQTAGTPVISNDLGALKETVHDACGLKLPGNPKDKNYQEIFAQHVIDVCNADKELLSTETWESMNKECLKQDFSWKKTVDKWKEELVKCFGEQPMQMVQ
jgi:glycosyltransferase involved in cell wall biosynthesis